jgi:hypothetical protein
MAEHASDCALHNAPAQAPEPCTCGASPLFRHWAYAVVNDEFSFQLDCRETLIARCVSAALGAPFVASRSRHIRRAVNEGFEPDEMAAFLSKWRDVVLPNPEQLERRGMSDCLVSADLSPLPELVRAQIAKEPDMSEIQNALAPWIDYWRSLESGRRAKEAA